LLPQQPPFMLPRPLAPLFLGLGKLNGGPLWLVWTTFNGFSVYAGFTDR